MTGRTHQDTRLFALRNNYEDHEEALPLLERLVRMREGFASLDMVFATAANSLPPTYHPILNNLREALLAAVQEIDTGNLAQQHEYLTSVVARLGYAFQEAQQQIRDLNSANQRPESFSVSFVNNIMGCAMWKNPSRQLNTLLRQMAQMVSSYLGISPFALHHQEQPQSTRIIGVRRDY